MIPPPADPGTSFEIEPVAELVPGAAARDRHVTSAPPPDGGLVLLETIKLTAQRAQAAQRAIRNRSPRQPRPVMTGSGDEEQDRIRLEHLDSIYVGAEELGLPSPSVTNTNLHHYLLTASATQPRFSATASRGWRSRLRRLLASAQQEEFNTAVLHALHQLDHRTKVQEHVIVQLEARLADACRSADRHHQVLRS